MRKGSAEGRSRTVGLVAGLALACLLAGGARAEPMRMARHPALSPDGGVLVFSYAGDLWRAPTQPGADGVSLARRLTAHPAADGRPVVSPDGRWVAFASAREHAPEPDVYVVPLAGGPASRLTWDSAADVPLAFTPDSAAVVFESRRRCGYPERSALYLQPLAEPAEPRLLLDRGVTDLALSGVTSSGPSGIVALGGCVWWRKGYRGSCASDLWRIGEGGAFERLTGDPARDRWPLLAPDGRLLWVSGRSGTDNLWMQPQAGGEPAMLTRFARDGVRFPCIAARTGLVAFEQGDGIHVLDPCDPDAEPRRLHLEPAAEVPVDRTLHVRVREASEVAPSPDGKVIAFVARGEVYVRRLADGVPVRLTDSPARDHQVVWAPDGRALFFVSDRSGSRDIFRVRAADGEDGRLHRARRHAIEPVVATPARESLPCPSPDGKRLVFVRGRGDLCLVDLGAEGAEPRVVLPGWSRPSFVFSPDGRWLALSREDDDHNSDVWLLELDTGRRINVSQHPDDDFGPAWSPDGRKLAFLSKRHGDELDAYLVHLRRDDDERTREERADAREDGGGKGAKKSGPPDVRIDGEGLWQRVRRVKALLGDQSWVGFTSDSQRLLLRSAHADRVDLYSCALDGGGLKELTRGHDPRGLDPAPRAKTVFYLKHGKTPARVNEAGGGAGAWGVDVWQRHPRAQVRGQVFDEGWRALRDYWYDPAMNGLDWAAERERYRELALSRPTHAEFQEVFRLMLGELNGSHLGIGGGGEGGPPSDGPLTGRLGVSLAPADGGWLVTDVVPDGPCDSARARLAPGDRVEAVDGEPLDRGAVLARALAGKLDRDVALAVRRGEGSGTTTTTSSTEEVLLVRPVSDRGLGRLSYRRWVDATRRLVEERSGGRLGYLHVRSMTTGSLETFEAELHAHASGRDALVIDVRNNGGGWTADFLLAILAAPEHAYTRSRGSRPGYPQGRRPLAAWTRPVAVLINERSFSNAEIFAHAIRTTGRGLLVGRQTFGGVISTGSIRLLDGSHMRMPLRGWYVLGTGHDMDRGGAVPHIAVDQPPGEAGDRQAEAAVDALLRSLAH